MKPGPELVCDHLKHAPYLHKQHIYRWTNKMKTNKTHSSISGNILPLIFAKQNSDNSF